MDYADEEMARLLARSDELEERGRDLNLRGAKESSALRRLLARCAEVCRASDRVYARRAEEAGGDGRAGSGD